MASSFWPVPKPAVVAAIAILKPAFPGLKVASKMPCDIRVTRVGGHQPNPAQDIARLLVECRGANAGVCEARTGTARAALRNAGGSTFGGAFIFGWSGEQGPVDFPDPDNDADRWQFTGDLWISTD